MFWRKRRLVRLHLVDPFPSVEGICHGRVNGHYVVQLPKLLEAEGRSHSLEGILEVPAERVVYRQVIG